MGKNYRLSMVASKNCGNRQQFVKQKQIQSTFFWRQFTVPAQLPVDKIAKYIENYQQYSAKAITMKRLQNCIDKANIYNSLSQDLKLIPKINIICEKVVDRKMSNGTQSYNVSKYYKMNNDSSYTILKTSRRSSKKVQEQIHEQNNFIQQIVQKQIQINEKNIIELLENGFIQKIRKSYSTQQFEVKTRQLKQQLLNRFGFQKNYSQNSYQSSQEDLEQQEQIKNKIQLTKQIKKIRRNKTKQQKKNILECKNEINEEEYELKINSIKKLYLIFKLQHIEREKSQDLSIYFYGRIKQIQKTSSTNFKNLLNIVIKWIINNTKQDILTHFDTFLQKIAMKEDHLLEETEKTKLSQTS